MTIKTLPHWISFFRLISKDFDRTGRTYKDVFEELFIENTDIYNKFLASLKTLHIPKTAKVNFDTMIEKSEKFTVEFDVEISQEKKILINKKSGDEFLVPKSSTETKVLDALGYSKIFI